MTERGKKKVRCEICGNEKTFNVISARISAREVRQVTARKWKRITVQYRQPDHRVPLAVICGGCGVVVNTQPQALEGQMTGARENDGRSRRQTRKA